MTDTELLELRRKVCEALYPDWWIGHRDNNPAEPLVRRRTIHGHPWPAQLGGAGDERVCEALESDNGLALDAANKLCRERKYWWNMGTGYVEDGREYYYFNIGEMGNGNAYTLANCEGETPALAICGAIIAASAKGKEGKSDEAD